MKNCFVADFDPFRRGGSYIIGPGPIGISFGFLWSCGSATRGPRGRFYDAVRARFVRGEKPRRIGRKTAGRSRISTPIRSGAGLSGTLWIEPLALKAAGMILLENISTRDFRLVVFGRIQLGDVHAIFITRDLPFQNINAGVV